MDYCHQSCLFILCFRKLNAIHITHLSEAPRMHSSNNIRTTLASHTNCAILMIVFYKRKNIGTEKTDGTHKSMCFPHEIPEKKKKFVYNCIIGGKNADTKIQQIIDWLSALDECLASASFIRRQYDMFVWMLAICFVISTTAGYLTSDHLWHTMASIRQTGLWAIWDDSLRLITSHHFVTIRILDSSENVTQRMLLSKRLLLHIWHVVRLQLSTLFIFTLEFPIYEQFRSTTPITETITTYGKCHVSDTY